VIVIFPTKYDMERKQYHLNSNYYYMKEVFQKQHYRFIDLLDDVPENLKTAQIRAYFGPTLHYSAEGNAWAARQILGYLERNNLLQKEKSPATQLNPN